MENETEHVVDGIEEQSAEDRIFYVFHLCYIPAISVIGVLGNLTSMSVFLGTRMKKHSSSYFLAAMSASDSSYLVLLFLHWLFDNDVLDGVKVEALRSDAGCKITNYVGATSTSISVWLTVAYTLERCIAVQYPLLKATICTVGRAKIAISFIVFANSVYYVYYLVTTGLRDNDCGICDDYMTVMMVLNAVDITLMVFLPFCLIGVMNYLIVWKLWNLSRIFQSEGKNASFGTCEGAGDTPVTPLLPQPQAFPESQPPTLTPTPPQTVTSAPPPTQTTTPSLSLAKPVATGNKLTIPFTTSVATSRSLDQKNEHQLDEATTTTSFCIETQDSQIQSPNTSEKPLSGSLGEHLDHRGGFSSAPNTVLHKVHTDIFTRDISASDTNLVIRDEAYMRVSIHKSGHTHLEMSEEIGKGQSYLEDIAEKVSRRCLEVSRLSDTGNKEEVDLSTKAVQSDPCQNQESMPLVPTTNDNSKQCAIKERKISSSHNTSGCNRPAKECPSMPQKNINKSQDKARIQDNSAYRQESASHRQDNPTNTRNNITKMLLLISTLFILLQLPSYLVRAYVMITRHHNDSLVKFQRIFMCLYHSHFSINFILYSKSGSKFWECLRSMVLSKLKRLVRWYRLIFFKDQPV